ncbi:hypothetical protein U8Z98_002613 [Stenotrophomonas maltophilia]|uniref:hypothetical protein n=1 Tax=Stenotrophomonas TaxID=40323 RepID=UPI00070DFB8E|nr:MULTISPECIES: hypothetical protein [Stenotrophomonas]KRG42114.1 hypothetical protein ARC63_11830 [Stenotrophomonas geniculata ATCC 19374 = JCM 13324]EMB2746182.1 hypothetical protein [Stenotrophomonas maltophilia]MBA0283783.1 hypothetical protein [Stenotrophomonas maltophilia]MBA0324090.1 hypothetical protein [Stenotrophomonas maltophilia]MDH2180162.1 hypothetical protein [Stenotrophomonas sp. GD03654]
MAIRTEGWPVAEAMVRAPQGDQWPFATEAILIPFDVQDKPEPINLDILQVVIVPRASWERIIAHVPADVLQREGVANG